MALMILAALMAAALTPAAEASTRPACSSYLGTAVQAISIDAAFATLGKVPGVKSEYETRAQFAARQAAAASSAPLIIAAPIDLKYVRYDADAQMLQLSLYALDNRNVGYADLFGYGTPYDDKVAYGAFANKDVVIGEREGATGSYVGRTALGARARVTRVARITKAIFDREAEPSQGDLFDSHGPDHIVGGIPRHPPQPGY